MKLLHDKFLHQEKKISHTSIPKISIYLFKHFYLFFFIFTLLTDFPSLKIQMQMTLQSHLIFYAMQPSQYCKQKYSLVNDFIKMFII